MTLFDHARHAAVRPRAGRALLAGAVLVNAAVLVVGSTVAAFSGQATVQQPSSSGRVSIVLDDAGRAAVALGVEGLAAGDWFERALTVSPASGPGAIEIDTWSLSTTAAPSTALTTTATDGLRLKVERCSVAWTEVTTTAVQDYACSGTTTTAFAERDVIMSGQPLAGLVRGPNHLRLTVKLAATAPDSLQALSTSISYTFAGVQRAGQAR